MHRPWRSHVPYPSCSASLPTVTSSCQSALFTAVPLCCVQPLLLARAQFAADAKYLPQLLGRCASLYLRADTGCERAC